MENTRSWFYRTPSLTLAIGPPGGRTVVSPARKLNLDDITHPGSTQNPPMGSSGCSQNTGVAVDDIGALFNDGPTATKYVSPSPPIARPVISQVAEHVQPKKVNSPPPQPEDYNMLDDTLGSTTQKTDGR